MKINTTCDECGIHFKKRRDKILKQNFCSRSCWSNFRTGKPVGKGEWALLGRKAYMKKYLKAYVQNNKEAHNERGREWVKKNKEKRNEVANRWARNNKDKCLAAVNKRRATKINATPLWVNLPAVEHYYITAKRIEAETGIKVHVDHIIPLKSKTVCGLHCEHNLRLLPAKENMKKGNRFNPDDGIFNGMTHGFKTKEFIKVKKQVEDLYPVIIEVV